MLKSKLLCFPFPGQNDRSLPCFQSDSVIQMQTWVQKTNQKTQQTDSACIDRFRAASTYFSPALSSLISYFQKVSHNNIPSGNSTEDQCLENLYRQNLTCWKWPERLTSALQASSAPVAGIQLAPQSGQTSDYAQSVLLHPIKAPNCVQHTVSLFWGKAPASWSPAQANMPTCISVA